MTEATTTETTTAAEPELRTPADILRSLTGHEENAIEAHFGRDQEELGFGRQLRALVFTLRTRAGVEPGTAYREVMAMPAQDVFNAIPSLAEATDTDTDEAEPVEATTDEETAD